MASTDDVRLFKLAHAYLDQQMQPEQLRELEELLRISERARQHFAVLVSLHRQLYDQYRVQDMIDQLDGSDASGESQASGQYAVLDDLLEAEASATASLVHMDPAEQAKPVELKLAVAREREPVRRVIVIPVWLVGGAAVAALVAFALLITALLPDKPTTGTAPIADNPRPTQSGEAFQGSVFFATVVDIAYPSQSPAPPSYRIGDRIRGRVELGDELVELRLHNGVHVVLQGPLVADLRGPEDLFLEQGEVVVDVSDSDGGYVVTTDSARFRDIGTVFAVNRSLQGISELFVLSGEVVAERPLPGRSDLVEHVRGGQSAVVRPETRSIVVSHYFDRAFSLNARDGRARYRMEQINAAVLAYWRFEPEHVVATPLPDTQDLTQNLPAVRDASGNGNHLFCYNDRSLPNISTDRVPGSVVPGNGLTNRQSLYVLGHTGGFFHDLFVWGAFSTPPREVDLQRAGWEQWTVEASFWPENLEGEQTIISFDGEHPVGGERWPTFSCRISDGRLIAIAVDSTGTPRQVVSSQPIMPRDWTHVAVAFTQDEMRLMVRTARTNGKYINAGRTPLDGGMMVPPPRPIDGMPQTWAVGRGMLDGSFTNPYTGYIDEVRFTRLALHDDELLFSEPQR